MKLQYEQEYHEKKSLVCAIRIAGGVLLRTVKDFEVMLNIFEFSRVLQIVES